jgi:hypothetical protein
MNETMDNPQTDPNVAMQDYGLCPNDYQESA